MLLLCRRELFIPLLLIKQIEAIQDNNFYQHVFSLLLCVLASFILQASITSDKFVFEVIFSGNIIEGIKPQQISFRSSLKYFLTNIT